MGERKSRVGKSEQQRRKRKGGVEQGERGENRNRSDHEIWSDDTKTAFPRALGGCQVPEHTPFQVLEGSGAQLSLCCAGCPGSIFTLFLPSFQWLGAEGMQQKFEKGHHRNCPEYLVFFSSPKALRKHPRPFIEKSISPSQATNRTRPPGGTARGELR